MINSSIQLAEDGDNHCWYAITQDRLQSDGINELNPFKYSLNGVYMNITRVEKNRVNQYGLIWCNEKNLTTHVSLKWIMRKRGSNPGTTLGRKMDHYKGLFQHLPLDGFIIRSSHINASLSYTLWSGKVGQLRTSSHQFEIETCTQSHGRRDLSIVQSVCGISGALCLLLCCLLRNEMEIWQPFWTKLWFCPFKRHA